MLVKLKKKSTLLIVAIALILLCVLAFGSLLKYRQEINNTEVLRSYRLTCTESTKECGDFLKKLTKDTLSQSLHTSTKRSHLYLHLVDSEVDANNLGISMEQVPDSGYLILRQGNGLYLLSKNSQSLTAACQYLVEKLVDADGNLLLKQDERYLSSGANLVTVYDTNNVPLSEYKIVCSKALTKSHANTLNYYISSACNLTLPVVQNTDNGSTLELCIIKDLPSPYSLSYLETGIQIAGRDEKGLLEGIYKFANTNLGYMFAGTEREKVSYRSGTLRMQGNNLNTPWMEEREPIITLWNTNYSRGIYLNDSTSLKTDIMSFSDEQLYEYVRMMKFCGFTGIQVTDMCSAWSGAGGYEYVHERLRFLADAAHSLDMKFTLWVWGSEFTGYGFVDNSVTYAPGDYTYAYENPEVIATFEKYYSIYASLADCCDRVIAHYYDPGNLNNAVDIAYFANMLRTKFLAANTNIDFGVSCWVDKYEKSEYVKAMGNDITLYENGHHDDASDYEGFRNFCEASGCRAGTWAWNTCEMEIDQLAQMNFNPHVIKETYTTAALYDNMAKPSYWSEMDSNHVINVFSLYCAASLLQNPTLDPTELTKEIALLSVGETYQEEFASILTLIEDARTGHSWDTYIWSNDNYILKSKDYPAADIYERSTKALSVLQEMIDSQISSYALPLPIALTDVLQLMVPQIAQIQAFASFRMEYDALTTMQANGATKEELLAKIDAIKTPISEYNTVTGLWGQIEARAQQEMLLAFCTENNLTYEPDPTFKQAQKNRMYSYFVSYQKGHKEPVLQFSPFFQYGIAYGVETTKVLENELLEEGLLSKDSATGGLYVTDWEHYKYSFHN